MKHLSTKTPSAREVALTKLRVAGYHADAAAFTQTYIEARVSYAVAKEMFRAGAMQRERGVRCDCNDCKAVQ